MRNMEEITDCSLEKNQAALDNVPRQTNWDDQRDKEELGLCKRRKNQGIKPETFRRTLK